ncbi:VOC family protein [Longispora albida]|uniref:VOC family protein n=1 Tax=Longispora albida TaxID=203523 RepID=UPI0003687C2C|nr:VOC family protein [Longispora albida]
MSLSLASVGAITLFVEDLGRAKEFYRVVFGAPVIHEDGESAAFTFDNTIVNLLVSTAAGELVAPVAVGAAGGGPRCQYTVWVDDAGAACALLAERGVTLLNGPVDRPWGVRTAAFADPDGNIWEIAQSLRS